MKNIKLLAGVLGIALTVASCSNYLDVNDSPNSVTLENISPEYVFPGAVKQMYRTYGTTMVEFGNLMMNSWAGNSYLFGSPYNTQYSLTAVNSSFYSGIWDNTYLNVNNFKFIEDFANPDHKYDRYIAMAKIMKVFHMQTVVDLYGDIPYSQAFKGQTNMTPAYDDDKEIYKSFFADLDAAQAIITSINSLPSSTNVLNPATRDVVFGGNMDNWSKFANNIKLRLAMRLSNVTGEMATLRDQKLAELSSAQFYETDVKQGVYTAANNDSANPFFISFRSGINGVAPQNYQLITASEHMANVLNGASTEPGYGKFTVVDPRRFTLFTKLSSFVPGTGLVEYIRGVRQGAIPGQPGAPAGQTTVSKLSNNVFSGAVAYTTPVGATRQGVLMSGAETKFLLAEAAVRYPAHFSGAQTKFDQAIQSHFTYQGATIGTYLTDIAAIPGLGLTGTPQQQIEAIMTQKWIALTNITPTEMFIEYNRTGYPWTPMATTASKPNKPYRLMYPNSEYVANSANVPTMSSDDCFTINAKTPFWKQ